MCGIFGLVANNEISENSLKEIINIYSILFLFSQTRGSEAAGIALNDLSSIKILKKQHLQKNLSRKEIIKIFFNY